MIEELITALMAYQKIREEFEACPNDWYEQKLYDQEKELEKVLNQVIDARIEERLKNKMP